MPLVTEHLFALFRDVHQQIRAEVEGQSADALNWTPGPETNSVAVLVTHLLGAEGDVLRRVRGLPSVRDRAAEFETRVESPAPLLARLDAADALLAESAEAISAAQLEAMVERPNRAPRPGIYWLLSVFGHVREHLAHLQLTRQLYEQRAGRG